MWDFEDDLIGCRVIIYTFDQDELEATVLAVHLNGALMVQLDDGTRMIGNQWQELGDESIYDEPS